MNPSPDLLHELRASRPVAPRALRDRVRETTRAQRTTPLRERLRLPARRIALVALPAALALALVSAGAIGLSRSSAPTAEMLRERSASAGKGTAESAPSTALGATQDTAIAPTTGRAQRVTATLTLEVRDADAVSRAAQAALDLTRSLGGHVVVANVSTGEQGSASMTVRVPVAKVQEAIGRLSALGRIASQQVTIDDLQESLDALERRQSSVRAQIARLQARLLLLTEPTEERAVLETRLQRLQRELRQLRRGIAATGAEARMSTIELTVVTPDALGTAPAPSRLDRTLDEALGFLVWEAVVVLAVAIVLAPFALLALAAWLGRRLHRRREDERLLAQS